MIQRVLAPNPGPMTLTGTNSWLIDDGAGHVAVIDPGPANEPGHLAAVLRVAKPLGQITTVLVTHRHLDHLPAAAPLCAETGATLVGHRDLPGVQRAVAEGETAFGPLQTLETPGHTRESLSYWDPSERALFTGDLVVGTGTVVLDDQPGALSDYLNSLERLLALQPRTIYPGHGPLVEHGAEKLSEYLSHRRERVQQVIDTLRTQGPSTVDQLTRAIYTEVLANLIPMAARNVRANLELLVEQGKAAPAGGERWQLTPTTH